MLLSREKSKQTDWHFRINSFTHAVMDEGKGKKEVLCYAATVGKSTRFEASCISITHGLSCQDHIRNEIH